MGAEEEVTEVDKLAVTLVFDIDDTPAVLAAAYWLSVNDNIALGADDGKGDHRADGLIVLELVLVKLIGVKWIQTDVVVYELGTDFGFEVVSLFDCQRVRLGNDRYDVDDLG